MGEPRTHGQCPTCRHYGSDCRCHERTQHTPGPWAIRDGCFIDGPNFTCLANVRAAHVPYEAEAIANARLIAAAPDLLAALKSTEATIAAWHDDAARMLRACFPDEETKYRNMRDNYAALLQPIRAAIAKAEGV